MARVTIEKIVELREQISIYERWIEDLQIGIAKRDRRINELTSNNSNCDLCGRSKKTINWCKHFKVNCICLYLVCPYC